MAKKATPAGGKAPAAKKSSSSKRKPSLSKAVRVSSASRKSQWGEDAVDALINLLKSPLVAELLAVGATAAMAAITEARVSRKSGDESARMMKAAGKAAAAAIGRRLTDEFEEIRNVSRKAKERAKA